MIRDKNKRGEEMDKVVDELLVEMGKDKGSEKKPEKSGD